MITKKLTEAAQQKIKNYPCNNVRASEIGHPCERYIILSITNWEDKKLYDIGLQNIFDLGNAIEAEVIRRIKESGLEVLTARKNFKITNPLITGREDIMLQDPDNGELYPCEIKGLSPIAFDNINSVQDMFNHKSYYIRKYPAQLQIYMYNFNKEKGYFALFNKITGQIKILDCSLDYDYTESLLQKAESVYTHIKSKTLPNCIDDESICSNCPLLHVCGAEIRFSEAIIDTGELQLLLERRDKLLPYVKEYTENREQINYAMRDFDKVFTADYFIQKKVITRKSYVVSESKYEKISIQKII